VECAVNLLDELAVEECVKQLLEKFGKIDIAVMTAGGFAMGDLSDTGISELEHQYRLRNSLQSNQTFV
jgi:NADP-dependent 3-hydroxy acid dehydrogenase YdfG